MVAQLTHFTCVEVFFFMSCRNLDLVFQALVLYDVTKRTDASLVITTLSFLSTSCFLSNRTHTKGRLQKILNQAAYDFYLFLLLEGEEYSLFSSQTFQQR